MVALWISYAFGFTNLADQTAIRVLGLRPLNDVYIVVFKSVQFKHRTGTITPKNKCSHGLGRRHHPANCAGTGAVECASSRLQQCGM